MIEQAGCGGTRPLRIAQWGKIRWWNACAWYLVQQSLALDRIGHHTVVLAPPSSPIVTHARALGLETPDFEDLEANNPWTFARRLARVRDWLRIESIDLINVHTGAGHSLLAAAAALNGLPLVRTRGDIRLPRIDPAHAWLYRRADHHLATAEFLRRSVYPPLGVPLDRVTTLLGGSDRASFDAVDGPAARREVRHRLGVGAESRLIGMVARLSPVKGHRDLLEAAVPLLKMDPDLHLVLPGGDAQLTAEVLREEAREIGLELQVHLPGRVEDPLVWAAALDIAVIASIDSEAICRSAMEYLGLGLPIVATRLNAVAEVVGDGGVLVPPSDPSALGAALRALLASEARRVELGRAARSRFEQEFTLERFGESSAALFGSVLDQKARTGSRA